MKSSQKNHRVVGALLILIAIAGSHTAIYFVVTSSPNYDTSRWLINYGVSLAQDLVVAQFFKAIVQASLIRKVAGNKNKRGSSKSMLMFLIDKLVLRAMAA